ncbi:hypothetical protein [Gloeobacter violaceus]|uniref:Gll0169 protein n=1 Tax=Gloeobacter violaceus (strain ATCC 29082 / PCC 7421) TaxID=251221 RepID=Q7NP88_GLOVI|nr:hypothetical protein [Gloeobacter violaceus]BAC88110.1 gll0169 [Gloeobacter violaceus PCC 7421]
MVSKKRLIVIPGDQGSPAKRAATVAFCAALGLPHRLLAPEAPPYLPGSVRALLADCTGCSVVVIAFSAGVVGAAAALQRSYLVGAGITIEALIALDGWLVPLFHAFPIYRLSHDAFTHRTSLPFGMGRTNFFADPAVAHLDLWTAPNRVVGWQVTGNTRVPTTALAFIYSRLREHSCTAD